MRSFRFPRIRDSLSLPYLQDRQKIIPPPRWINNTPPPVPPIPSATMPYPQALPLVMDHSLEQLAPLVRYTLFCRPRADSLTSLKENRGAVLGSEIRQCSPTTVRSSRRLERVAAVDDIFSRINRQAESLGVITSV